MAASRFVAHRAVARAAAGLAASIAFAPLATAHHSRSAVYDPMKTARLAGIVTKVEWQNPHVHVRFDVRDEHGTVTAWTCEGAAPNALYQRGWRSDSFKNGEPISLVGELARDGSPRCSIRSVVLNGEDIFTGDASSRVLRTTPAPRAPPPAAQP